MRNSSVFHSTPFVQGSAPRFVYCIPCNWASEYRIINILTSFSMTLTATVFECVKGIIYSSSWYFCDTKCYYSHLIDREVRSMHTFFKRLQSFWMPNWRWPDLLGNLLHHSIIYPKHNLCAIQQHRNIVFLRIRHEIFVDTKNNTHLKIKF